MVSSSVICIPRTRPIGVNDTDSWGNNQIFGNGVERDQPSQRINRSEMRDANQLSATNGRTCTWGDMYGLPTYLL